MAHYQSAVLTRNSVRLWLAALVMTLASLSPSAWGAERQPDLEARLDSAFGLGLIARQDNALTEFVAELDEQTPTATYARVRAYQALSLAIQDNQPDAGLALIDETLGQRAVADSLQARAELLNARGEIYLHAQKRAELAAWLPELIAQEFESDSLDFHRLHLIGRSFNLLHDHEQALSYLLRAHEIVMAIQDDQLQRRRQFINLHVGRTHARLRHFERARETLDRTIEQSYRYGLLDQLPELYMVRGFVIQVSEGPNQAAESDFLKATEPPPGAPVGRTQMLAFNNLGAMNLHGGNYEAAEQFFEQGIRIADRIGNQYERHVMRFNQGYVMVKQGNHEEGLAIMEAALADFSQTAPLTAQADMLNYLADGYEVAGQVDQALAVVRRQLELREASHRAEREGTIAELQVRYDAQEASLRIQLLEQESALRDSRIAEQQRNQRWVLLLSTVLFIALSFALLGGRYVRKLNRQLSLANQELTELSNRDPLTRLYNRRALASFPEQQGDLVLLFDLDHFKEINDTFGHDVGDQVLQSVSQRLTAALRSEDLLIRWGGEEFLLVIRHLDENGIATVKDKIQRAIVHSPVDGVQVNASGGAVFIKATDTWQSAIRRADQLLYQAKQHGRAQIWVERDDQPQIW